MRIAQWLAEKRRPKVLTQLSELIPARDYTKLNTGDAELRLWVPEPVKLALDGVCERASRSLTAYLTEFFATYLYGHHEVLRMRETNTGLYEPFKIKTTGRTKEKFCLGVAGEQIEPNLGKNIFPLKVLVPIRLKSDLQKFAAESELTLGEFARSLISAHLFGQAYAARRKSQSKNVAARRANKWESELEN